MAVSEPSFFNARLTRIKNQLCDRLRMATHALQTTQNCRLAIDYLSPIQVWATPDWCHEPRNLATSCSYNTTQTYFKLKYRYSLMEWMPTS